LVKPFEDNVREENGMGFTDRGIFIPPPMVKNIISKMTTMFLARQF
jgi:hypothetical protein